MKQGQRRQAIVWQVTTVPGGTRQEAEQAARRARELVVRWLGQQQEEAAAEGERTCP